MSEENICKVIADYMLDEAEAKIKYPKLEKRISEFAEKSRKEDVLDGAIIDSSTQKLIEVTLEKTSQDEEAHERVLLAIHKILKCPV